MRWNPFKRQRGAPKPVVFRFPWRRRSYIPLRLEELEARITPTTPGPFQLDGDAITQVTTPPTHDWDQVYNDAVLNPGQNTSGSVPGGVAFIHDPVNSGTDNIFTGGSSKDIYNVNQWLWNAGPAPQAKDDLADVFAVAYDVPVNGVTHTIIDFGADRYANNGSSTLGFWFFQNPVSQNANGTFSGAHTVGDILIVADFSSAAASINAYEWVGGSNPLQPLTTNSTNLFETANTVNIPTGGWPFQDKGGSPANTLAPGEFVEGGIDMTALGLPDCDASFLAETRASNSTTSILSDFALGRITTCAADLAVTKTDGKTSAVPGTSTTYTITVSNAGPDDVTGASVSDPLPAGVTGGNWTFVSASGGGTVSGPSSGSGALANTVNLPVNASVTFSFTVQVSPSATGTLTNTATVTPPAGVTDTNPTNNSATDTDSLTPQADLSITKTDGVTSVIPGTSTTYTIVVTNAGPSTAVNQQVTDLFPAEITSVSWTAVASAGSSVAAASGSGDILTTVTLLPGGTVTFTAVAQISPLAQREVASLVNTATVAVPPGDNTPADNNATDTDSLTRQAGLAVSKDDGKTTAVPGTSTTYTIVVSNAGPSSAHGVALSDPLPAGVTSATWTFAGATGGGSVTGPSSGSGALTTTVDLPVGATVTFSFTAQIAPTATGSLVNIATATLPGQTPVSGSDTDTLTPQADLAVTKDDGKTNAVPGTSDTYTITVSNNGPSTVSSVLLTDDLPAALLNPVFGTPSAGSYDPATGIWSGLSLAQGQSVTITLTGTIDPKATGTLTNTVHVAPPSGVTDPNAANDNASDTDTLTPQADLAITKTDNVTSVAPGTLNTYTITVSNSGPSAVTGASVSDPADRRHHRQLDRNRQQRWRQRQRTQQRHGRPGDYGRFAGQRHRHLQLHRPHRSLGHRQPD